MSSKQYHLMMFPWLAFGHIIPFFEFSKKLAAKGIRISFISTPRNLQRLPSLPPNLANHIKFVETVLPSTNGLPENCEATIDLPLEQIQYLKKACDSLQAQFEELVLEDLPDLIVFDFVQCWVPASAAKFGVPCTFFSAYSASALAFLGPSTELKFPKRRTSPEDFTVSPEWFPFPSLVAHRPDQAAIVFQNVNFPDLSGMSTGQRFATTLEGCHFVAVRSCREFEGAYISLLEELYKKPVIPVGLLPPNLVGTEGNLADISNWSAIFKWLGKQARKSVVFVGFGTEYKMPMKQVHELAYGLELSKLPFVWILRKTEDLDSSELLPTGFLARTVNQGIVSLGWVPQMQILAHPAIGGCLFHSGWGTIIESLGFGHPQILMPVVADQGLNAKLLVEKGIGLQVQSNEDGSFNRNAVALSLRLVMVEPEGQQLRSRAVEMQTVFANQDLHDDYIEEFIKFIGNHKK